MEWLSLLSNRVFALLYRPESAATDSVEVLTGDLFQPASMAEIPLHGQARSLVLVPYRQIGERGYDCPDDGTPLVAIQVTHQLRVELAEVLSRLPRSPIQTRRERFDIDDEAYGRLVERIIADEIGQGEGANFVIKRSFTADIEGYGLCHALSFFRRLLERESGAYWIFLVHMEDRTLVGATPEGHVRLRGGNVHMNPISGTYRYPPAGPSLPELIEFLNDRKEVDELYMVVDEELKMMARICEGGGQLVGPHLKEMARLAHTEYFLLGQSRCDAREILYETMFAPTVTGSPLQNACRVISRYEPGGRGYYSGIIASIDGDGQDGVDLDSAILIRTADIDRSGHVRIDVGATVVRHSDPVSEAAETRAKAEGLLAALRDDRPVHFGEHPQIRAALAERNKLIAPFWLSSREARAQPEPVLAGLKLLIVDAEDNFTSMIAHQVGAMGLAVTVRQFDEPYSVDEYDLIMMGPGPGDPRATEHPKIASLLRTIEDLLERHRPFIAVCLSHQILSQRLGLALVRRPVPNQGIQREIDLFGSTQTVGFYNSFVAHSQTDLLTCPGLGAVEISRDRASGEVHGLRGPFFASLQFHSESVLTQNGVQLIADRLREALQL